MNRPDAAALGRLGEDAALSFYLACGYHLLARRVRRGCGEIDLVVTRASVIVFVEVRTRGPGSVARAAETITRDKLRRLRTAARAWLAEQPSAAARDLRCDVVAIDLAGEGKGLVLRHFPGAG